MAINSKIKKISKGFTLVEISIVLVIAATLLALSLSVGAARLEAHRYSLTVQRMMAIESALELYARDYGRLPCPADPQSYAVDDPNFGWENINQTEPTPCNALNLTGPGLVTDVSTKCYSGDFWTPCNVRGAVPIRSLNLPPTVAIDGWDNKIMYETSTYYATTNGYIDSINSDRDADRVDIYNAFDEVSWQMTVATHNAFYILYSSGSNASYSYNSKAGGLKGVGTASPAEGDDELVNYDTFDDDDYVQRPMTKISSNPSAYFDDIIFYKSKFQMSK